MYELKTNTAVRIAVGPLVDPTDGKTAETALTVTGMTVDILQMDNDGTAVNRTSFSPTASGGNNDMVHITSDAVGMYDLELTAAQLNFLGNARLVFYDLDGFLVHWIDIQVVSAAYFDWKYGTTIPNVNVTQLSGDGTAADNAEAFFDGTGYAGTNNVIPTTTTVTNMVTANVTQISGDSTAADNLELYCDGTTPQPVNVTQMGGSALSTSSAQIGVNVIQAAGTAWGSGAITAGSIASNAIAAAKIATGAITNAKFAAGAIDAAAIAANAIGASELADDAVTEIVTGVWNAATASYGGAGTYGQAVEDILADTSELQTDNVDGGRTDLLIDAIKAKTDNLPTDPADQSAVEAAITAAHSTTNGKIDTVDDFLDTEVAAIKTVTDKLDTALELDVAVYRFTTNALEQAPTGGSAPTAAAIADAVWDEALSGHTGAGSAGEALDAASTAGDPWLTALPGAYGAGTAGKIIGDNLNAPVATVDTVVDGIVTELAKVPKSDSTVTWNSTALASIQTECTDALNAYDPPTKTEMDSAFTTTNDKIDTMDDFLHDEIMAILTDTNELQTDLANGGRLDLLIDAIKAKTDNLTFTVAGDVDVNVQTWKGSTAPAMTGDAYAVVSNVETGCVGIATEVAGLTVSMAKIPKSDSTVTWNATALGSIQSECADALNAYDPPTKTEMDSAFSTTNGKIDTIDDFLDTEIAAISSAITTMDGKVDSILEDTGTTLPAALAACGGTIWNTLLTALTTTGSIGKALADWLVARPAGSTAFTASDVAVCNNALLLVGNTSITALTDDTKAAKLCLQFYQQSLDAVLRAYTWNCATVRSADLTATTTPTFGYSYAFTLPADCLRVLMIEDDQTIPFKVESGVLLTDESTCKISYIKRITPDDADSLLLEAISARLAATIAFPLTNSTSASEAAWKLYEKKLDEAQSVDAFEGTAPQMASDDWINSRS
jgi:hypothetical protein